MSDRRTGAVTPDRTDVAGDGSTRGRAADAAVSATVLTPTLRQSTRRALFWVIAVVAAVLLTLGTVLVGGAAGDLPRLSAENAAPDGARAVAEVLRQQGVDVVVTDSLDGTEEEVDEPADTTVLVYDPDGLLDDGQRARLDGIAAELVLLEPGFDYLQELAPDVSAAGVPDDDPLVADCSFAPAEAAGTVSPGGVAYRAEESADAQSCLRSDSEGDDAYSLVRVESGDGAVTVVGATDALTNGEVLERGNAAFALGLLGSRDRLVWYLPSDADLALDDDPASLTPGWVTPTILLLMVTTIAAGVWRGRRFGPLIVENLPVLVRASETMEGRARLYQTSSARLRALDALRIGALTRLARRCGLPSTATVDDIARAVAAAVSADARDIRSLLVDAEPASDADLVRLSDRLLDLEQAVERATRP